MGYKPLTKVIPRNLDGPIGLVARIDFGVDEVGITEGGSQIRVNMVRKRPEGLLVPVEAVDVDKEESPALVTIRDDGVQGLRGR